MPALLKDLGQAKYGPADETLIRGAVIEDSLRYFQYKAFAAKDPAVCDQMASLQKEYSGITRTAAWGCREWYWDMSVANALATKSPRVEWLCRQSVAHDYPNMTEDDGLFICSTIASNISDPSALCAKLIPKYMGGETHDSCVNEFSRYSRHADIGKTQSGVPDLLFSRYVALDLYTRANAAKDILACGASELCRVLMGQGDRIAEDYAAKIKESVCRIAVKDAPAAPEQSAGGLLDLSERLLSQAELRPEDSRRPVPSTLMGSVSPDCAGLRPAQAQRPPRPATKVGRTVRLPRLVWRRAQASPV